MNANAQTTTGGISLISINSLPMRALAVITGSLLLWLSAKVQVPFWPVPMTLQVLVVLGLGAALGARMAVATVGLYLAEGALGLPVFASGGGLAYMTGPTGGYLLGFLLAAAFVGRFAAGRGLVGTLAVMLAGVALIYIPGVTWLASFTGFDKALALGVAPFITGDVLKAAIAAGAVHGAWSMKRRG